MISNHFSKILNLLINFLKKKCAIFLFCLLILFGFTNHDLYSQEISQEALSETDTTSDEIESDELSDQDESATLTSLTEVDKKINAGLLSDIWFSKIDLNYEDELKIYGSFQNTSGQDLEINYSFHIDDEEISNDVIEIPNNSIVKIETDWQAETGEFDVSIKINEIGIDFVNYSPDNLLKKEANLKVKISREINVEYIKEISTNIYENTISSIDNVASDLNNALQDLKVKKNVDVDNQISESASNENVKGEDKSQDFSDETDGRENESNEEGITNSEIVLGTNKDQDLNNPSEGQVAGFQFSNEDVLFDWKNNFGDSFRNLAISALQFLIFHWKFLLSFILFIIVFLFLKKRFVRNRD